MKKSMLLRRCRGALAALLVPVLMASATAGTNVEASEYEFKASYIQQTDDYASDYQKYLDNSVMFRLPEGVGADEEISVIVTVDGTTVMDAYDGTDKTMSISEYALGDEAQSIRDNVASQKAQVLKNLDELGVAYTTGEDYSTVLSGFELVIEAGDFATVGNALADGMDVIVGEVYNTCETELVENEVNVFDTGIFDSSDSGYDGSGMVVAVLDTGLDSNHTAFSVDNFTSKKLGLEYDEVAELIDETAAAELLEGLTVDDVYINEKVPFGFDYADNDSDVYSTHNNHGTHVSGVIVGNDDTIRGVAPQCTAGFHEDILGCYGYRKNRLDTFGS